MNQKPCPESLKLFLWSRQQHSQVNLRRNSHKRNYPKSSLHPLSTSQLIIDNLLKTILTPTCTHYFTKVCYYSQETLFKNTANPSRSVTTGSMLSTFTALSLGKRTLYLPLRYMDRNGLALPRLLPYRFPDLPIRLIVSPLFVIILEF